MASRLCSMRARNRSSPKGMDMSLALLLVADRVDAPQSEPAVPSLSRPRARRRVGRAEGELEGPGELVDRRQGEAAFLVEEPLDGVDRDAGLLGCRIGGEA